MTRIALLCAAVLLCLPAASRADEASGKQGPCKADYEKFCKDVKPGGGRIIQCMKEHQDDLSPECKARIAKAKEKMQQAKADFENACGDDVKKLCGDAKDGRGAVMKCIRENRKDLSDGCKSFLKEKRQKMRARRAARRARRDAQGAGQGGGSSQDGGQGQGGSSGGDQGGGSSQDGGSQQ